MGLIDEIKRMQQEGRADQEIVSTLINQGFPAKDVQESLTQARIKEAVLAEPNNRNVPAPIRGASATSEGLMPSVMDPNQPQGEPGPQEYSAMDQTYNSTQSQQNSEQQNYSSQTATASTYSSPTLPQPPTSNYPYGDYPQQYQQQDYPQQPLPQGSSDYPQIQQDSYSYSQGLSADTINEISEQILSEKLTPIKNKIEEIASFKNIMESKIDYLDERLKRIEKTIDRLQLSVLQKVGDYMTNVEDIKKELVETQKTFKALVPSSGINYQNQQSVPTKNKLS
ncbi:MAG: hypothetical protein Q8Q31_01405 [Nanoarchaeota archaeon]|nr:hypothetical protein [Nanoarchaeota archaeon]